MNLKLTAKLQSSVTLSSGEGRGEVLKASSLVDGRAYRTGRGEVEPSNIFATSGKFSVYFNL